MMFSRTGQIRIRQFLKKQKTKPSKNNLDKSQRNNEEKITSLIRKAKELVRSKLINKENEISGEQCTSFLPQDKRNIENDATF